MESDQERVTVTTSTSDVPGAATPPATATPRRTRPARPRGWSLRLTAYLLIAPAMLYLAVFLLYPLFRGVQLSFTDTRLLNPDGGAFVGLDNFRLLLESDRFWNSLSATLIYTASVVVFSLVLGTLVAALIDRPLRGRGFVRAVLTFPYAMPTVAVALIFIWMFNQSSGILNRALGAIGQGPIGWLEDPSFGMFAVVLATVWKVFPFVMLVMLAALQSVPDELYEATRIDGADRISTFRAIVLPHLLPTIRVVALLMTIWSIRRFEIIFLLTGGGPVERTNTLVINIYQQAFNQQRLGRAAAIGVLGLLLSLLVTVGYFFVERRATLQEQRA